jgi:hypothetical protein
MARTDTIITKFELQVSDVTELSTSEEYGVLNRVYNKVCNYRPWEFLKKSSSGAILQDADGYYITTPTDFAYFAENNQATNNTISPQNNASPKVIFIGTKYAPYQIVNWSDRRQYKDYTGVAYLDVVNGKIRFTNTPEAFTYEFDYIMVPPVLVVGASPLTPERFDDVYHFGMAVEDSIMQLSPKATSYAQENQAKYQSMLDDISYWNSQLIMN